MKRMVIFFTAGLLFFFLSCEKKGIQLTRDGTSDYEIVITSNGSEEYQIAALELQYYLHKITSVKIPIIGKGEQPSKKNKIFIGTPKDSSLHLYGISYKTLDKDVYISGGSPLYTRYAVYEFLEKVLGCKWYAPAVEVIPTEPSIRLDPIDYTYTPQITTRTVHSRLFYEDTTFADKQKVTHLAFPHYAPDARVHTFNRFLPEEKFYKSHPEYYALRGGKRLPTQLCLTNETVLQIVKDSVEALFKRHPEASVVSVSQNDNQQYCQCDQCRKIDEEEGSPAGTMIRFVNKVAAAFPEKSISTLAYQYTRKPCKTKPADNVLITLCSIECDRSGPIEEKCTDFAEDLKGWGQLTDHIRIWDYTTQFTNFLAPFPNLLTLQPNIQLFRDNNAQWVFEQHSQNPSELFALRSYITAKLLWNPDLDFDGLLTDFTNGYYEEAGGYVKKYIDLIHQKLKEDPDFFLFLYGDPSEAFSSYLSPEMLTEYTQFFDEAEKAVANKPEVADRVKMARLGVDYAVLEASRKNMTKKYSLTQKDKDGNTTANPKVVFLLENFKKTCARNNVTLMNEMGFTVEEYIANYRSAMEVAQRPNKALGKKVITLTKPKKYANGDPMVLTDGALGGSSFYANWLGYEGNNMEVVLDLENPQEISSVSLAFLQVTNHIVFFPTSVSYFGSLDGKRFTLLGTKDNPYPLNKASKVNDIEDFGIEFKPRKTRYIKIKAKNTKTPYWHHAAGLPSWIFADEIIVN